MFGWLRKAMNPRAYRPSDPDFVTAMAGIVPSAAGKTVTVDSAMQLSAVWACIRLISQTIGTLPFFVFRPSAGGGRVPATDHPLYTVLHDSPNADMTAAEFWGATMVSLLTHGNSYARIHRNGLGDVIAIDPLYAHLMSPKRMPDGSILYVYRPPGGAQEDLTAEEVLHIRGMSANGLIGMSPIAAGRQIMGISMAAEEAAGRVFENGMKASGFIETGGPVLSEEQRDRFKSAIREFSSSANAGRTMLLEGGFKYNQLSLSPEDAQLLSTREFAVDEICRWFAVQPHMIGHTTKGGVVGSGLEQQMLHFVMFTLAPWLKVIEQRVRVSLVKPADRGRVIGEFVVEGLLRADSTGRAALYASGAQNGWMTRNEIRRRENLSDEDGGERLTVQSNLVFLDKLGEVTADQTEAGFGLPPSPQDKPERDPVRQ